MEEGKNVPGMEAENAEGQRGQTVACETEQVRNETSSQAEPVEDIELAESVSVEELDTSPVIKAGEWLRLNEGNLKYLDSKKINRLKKLLENTEQIDESSLSEIQKLHEELEKELAVKFNKQFNDVKSGLVNLREEMFKIPNYDNLPDELQEVALNTFTNCELRLSNTRLIDELAEIFDNFKNIVYPDLSQKIYALENPNVLPVNLIEVLDSMPRLSFSTEEELDSALAKLRETAINRLNKAGAKK